jgi:hypothetical protein
MKYVYQIYYKKPSRGNPIVYCDKAFAKEDEARKYADTVLYSDFSNSINLWFSVYSDLKIQNKPFNHENFMKILEENEIWGIKKLEFIP